MTTTLRILLAVPLVGLAIALAQPEPPERACPDAFHLHEAAGHHGHGDHPHHHVGTDIDRNGDGWICVKHVSRDGSVHVHIDNNPAR